MQVGRQTLVGNYEVSDVSVRDLNDFHEFMLDRPEFAAYVEAKAQYDVCLLAASHHAAGSQIVIGQSGPIGPTDRLRDALTKLAAAEKALYPVTKAWVEARLASQPAPQG